MLLFRCFFVGSSRRHNTVRFFSAGPVPDGNECRLQDIVILFYCCSRPKHDTHGRTDSYETMNDRSPILYQVHFVVYVCGVDSAVCVCVCSSFIFRFFFFVFLSVGGGTAWDAREPAFGWIFLFFSNGGTGIITKKTSRLFLRLPPVTIAYGIIVSLHQLAKMLRMDLPFFSNGGTGIITNNSKTGKLFSASASVTIAS